jgi:regulator of protease activity HflC (stomatin/prohibitin superfamily)
MATKAEAERKREAQIIAAEGERETATKFAEAAQILASNPTAFRLRALETLVQMSRSGSTIVVVPSDLVQALHTGQLLKGAAAGGEPVGDKGKLA